MQHQGTATPLPGTFHAHVAGLHGAADQVMGTLATGLAAAPSTGGASDRQQAAASQHQQPQQPSAEQLLSSVSKFSHACDALDTWADECQAAAAAAAQNGTTPGGGAAQSVEAVQARELIFTEVQNSLLSSFLSSEIPKNK